MPAFDYTSGNPNNLVGGTTASMADIQGPFTDLKTFLNNRIAAVPSLVSSLPVSPVDGQEIYLLADASAGVVWHLRYRAASGSTFKWEFLGGSPMTAYQNSDATRPAGSAYAAIDGPAVSVPVGGDYVVRFNVHGYNTAAAGFSIATIVEGGAAVTDSNAVYLYSPAVNVETTSGVERELTLTGPAAFVAQYKSVGGTAHFLRRNMAVTPVRVG